MSGHSKWATTKHKKAIIDSRRAKSFAKLIKNIEVAAKMGGADLSGNPTLVDAIQKAKKTSVPNDNIDRAVKRGAGTHRRVDRLHDDHVRGLRPARRRPADRVPHRQQEPRGRRGAHADDAATAAPWPTRAASPTTSAARASSSSPRRRRHRGRRHARRARRRRRGGRAARRGLRGHHRGHRPRRRCARRCRTPGIDYDSADVEFVPNLKVEVDADTARKVFRLIDALEDSDDVQNVYSNFDLSRRGAGRARDDDE